MSHEDLAPLFGPGPAVPSQDVRYRQGTIVEWNPATLENVVSVGGSNLVDLPVLGMAEVDTFAPGDSVGIIVVGEAAKTYAILGLFVTPGTPQAAAVLSRRSSQIFSDFIITGEGTSSTTYTDLATVGPQVTVPVGPSGRILVMATAQIQWATGAALTTGGGGLFDVEFAGANVRAINEAVDPLVGLAAFTITTATNNSESGLYSVTTQAVFDSLNPGDTTITMKYRKTVIATADPTFHRRTLTAFKL